MRSPWPGNSTLPPSRQTSSPAKNGPTVCEGVGAGMSHPHRCGVQHHVESVAERDALDAVLEIELGEQKLSAGLRHAVEDRIDREQGIARKEHLRDQPLRVRVAEQREVDVG